MTFIYTLDNSTEPNIDSIIRHIEEQTASKFIYDADLANLLLAEILKELRKKKE